MIYALLRLAWEKNILVIGLVKDIAAAEMIKTGAAATGAIVTVPGFLKTRKQSYLSYLK